MRPWRHPVAAFLGRRILLGILTMWIVSIVCFAIIQLPPGDFVSSYIAQLAQSGGATALDADRMRREYGLDQPMVIRYVRWLSDVLHGNFGISLDFRRPVADLISERLGLTLALSIGALLMSWLIALPVGIFSAARRGTVSEHIFTTIGLIGVAIPNFLLALGAMYFAFTWFNVDLGQLQSPQYAGAPNSLAGRFDLLLHLLVPSAILAIAGTARLIRILRANLLDELGKPYVVTARAKGLGEMHRILKYPTRVALNPFVSTLGMTLPQLLSGTVIVSLVLSIPTLGPLLLRALQAQDLYLASAILMLLSVVTVIGTLLSDILLAVLDPRIRLA